MTISKTVLVFISVCVTLSVSALEFKISTMSPNGSSWMNLLQAAADEVEEKTQGRVTFKFYGGGVMGDDPVVLRKIRVGQLHGAILQTGSLSHNVPAVSLYNLPMQFKDFEEADAVRESIDVLLHEELAERGFVTLGLPALGFAYAMSQHPVSSIEDARRLKVWSPKGDRLAADTLKGFGITPIPLSAVDVLTGLQTGLIDTIASPPVSVVALQWHTQIKYVLDIPFMYIYSVYILSARQFDKLSEADQETTKSVFAKAVIKSQQENIEAHEATTTVLKNRGVEFVTPSSDEAVAWHEAAAAEASRWVTDGQIDASLYQQLERELNKVRQP